MFKSSSFRPQTRAKLMRKTGFNVRGQPTFSEPETIRLAIIRLESESNASSIRTDKSGSKARADEEVILSRFLVEADAKPEIGDRLEVLGYNIRITSAFPRVDQLGGLSHYQVDGEIWV